MHDTIFVGMDVHKATISIAVVDGARGGEIRQLGNFLNRADHVDKLDASKYCVFSDVKAHDSSARSSGL
jgi:hypothetical protein